jgi:hypothetical protein
MASSTTGESVMLGQLVGVLQESLRQANLAGGAAGAFALWPSGLADLGWPPPLFRIADLRVSVTCIVQGGQAEQTMLTLVGSGAKSVAGQLDDVVIHLQQLPDGETRIAELRFDRRDPSPPQVIEVR